MRRFYIEPYTCILDCMYYIIIYPTNIFNFGSSMSEACTNLKGGRTNIPFSGEIFIYIQYTSYIFSMLPSTSNYISMEAYMIRPNYVASINYMKYQYRSIYEKNQIPCELSLKSSLTFNKKYGKRLLLLRSMIAADVKKFWRRCQHSRAGYEEHLDVMWLNQVCKVHSFLNMPQYIVL